MSSVKDGSDPIGLLVVAGRSGAAHRFGADDVVRLQNLTEQLASSLGKGLLHQRIEREARRTRSPACRTDRHSNTRSP